MPRPYPTLTTFPEDCCCTGPTIDSLSPGEGCFEGGTVVTIVGSGFVGVTSVTFNGVEAAAFTVENDFTIVAVTAEATDAALGTGDVVVTDSLGSDTIVDGWTYDVLLCSVEYWLAANYSGSGDVLGEMGVADMAFPGGAANPSALTHTSGGNYFWVPVATANNLSTPDTAVLDITGDITFAVQAAAIDWANGASQIAISKFTASGNQRSYRFRLDTTGRVVINTSTAGTNASVVTTQGAISLDTLVADGEELWFGAGLDVNDGAGNRVMQVWWSLDGETWTLLETITTAGTTTVFSGTSSLFVGADDTTAINPFAGKIFRAQVYSGSGFTAAGPSGTLVFDMDAEQGAQSTFTEQSPNAATVTVNRATSGAKTAFVETQLFQFATDDYLTTGADIPEFDFDATDPFSVGGSFRVWGTPAADMVVFAKKSDLTTAAGWAVYYDTSRRLNFVIGDGAASTTIQTAAFTSGDQIRFVAVRDVDADVLRLFYSVNGGALVTVATVIDSTTATLANGDAFLWGARTTPTSFLDGEERTVAIWGSALDAAQAEEAINEMIASEGTLT